MKTVTKIPVGQVTKPGVHDLMLMRDATMRFGVLHEIQVINLRVWPTIFLHKDAYVQEVRYDHEERIVELDLGEVNIKSLNLSDGAIKLDKAAKFLLGCDVRVKVVSESGLLYDGQPRDEKWLSITPAKKNTSAKDVAKKKKKLRSK